MENVTVKDIHGNRLGFYKKLSDQKGAIEKQLLKDYGPGSYKLGYQVRSLVESKTQKGKMEKRVSPRQATVHVMDSGSMALKEGVSVLPPRAGYSDNSEAIQNLIEAIQILDQDVQHVLEKCSTIEAALFEEDDDEENENDSEEKSGFSQTLAGFLTRPNIAKLVSTLMQPDITPEQQADAVGEAIKAEPNIIPEIVQAFIGGDNA